MFKSATDVLRTVMLVCVCSAPAAARGQELGWSGAAEVSGNTLFGSARARLVAASADLDRADSTLQFRSSAQLTYADSRATGEQRRVTARARRLSLGIDHHPYARVSPFVFVNAEASLQQRIASRFGSGAGAKYTFVRRDDEEMSVSLALLWERTNTLDALPNVAARTDRTRWSLRVRGKRQLLPNVRLSHVTFYQPAVDRASRFSVDTDTSLALDIIKRLAFTITLRDRYDSEATKRGASSGHDGQLLFGARTAF